MTSPSQAEIGSIMPQEHAFLRFTGTLNLNRIRIRKASLEHAGVVGLGEDILGTPTFNICTVDRYTGEVGITYNRCSAINFNENYRTNDFIREQARFYFCSSSGFGRYSPRYQAPRKDIYPEAGEYNG